jgi:hypothetical protein
MHTLLPLRLKIWAIIILFIAFSALQGIVSSFYSLSFGFVIAGIELILAFITAYSWPVFVKLPIKPAWAIDLNGEWKVGIKSQYMNGDALFSKDPIEGKLLIKQNWRGVSLRLETVRMTSYSRGAIAEYSNDFDELHLRYFFITEPHAEFRANNPPQTGCAFLSVSKKELKALRIRYCNDRGSTGDIACEREGS